MSRWLSIVALALVSCSEPDTVRLAAAASLSRVLPDVVDDENLDASFAASSTLARQIEHGYPADVFVSADRAWVDYLVERGIGATPVAVARNELVAWVRSDRPLADPRDLATSRIAVGSPDVPVGRYARRALAAIATEKQFVICRDAPAVLHTLRLGEADVAIAYATDGRAIPGLAVAMRFPEEITYWALVCRDRPEAHALLARLQRGGAAWQAHGFFQ